MASKITIGSLIILILATATYITFLPDDLKMRVDNDKSTFYVLENSRWVVSGREYNALFDGTSKMNRQARDILLDTFVDEVYNTTTIIRTTPYIRGPTIVDTYFFDGQVIDEELFPVSHIVEIFNGAGFFYRYEVRNLVYNGSTTKINQTSMEFGRNMQVTWQEGFRWAWVYKSGILKVQYDVDSDYERYELRLFDPVYVTDYMYPTDTGTSCPGTAPDEWTTSSKLTVADSDRAHSTTINDITDTCDYGMDYLNGTIVHGIEVSLAGLSDCAAACPPRPGAWASVRLSWNGGVNWTDWKESFEFLGASQSTKLIPLTGALTNDWNHTWIINETLNELDDSNFVVQLNFSRADANTDFKSPDGIDYLKIRLNITTPDPIINWTSEMITNGSSVGSIIRFRAESTNGVPIGCCSASFENDTAVFNRTDFNPSGDGDLLCSRVILVEDYPTNFSLTGVAYDSLCSVQADTTTSRWYNHSNTQPPGTSFIFPPNNSVIGGTEINLTWNLNDPENDFSNMWLYFAKDPEHLSHNFYTYSSKENGNFSELINIVPECIEDDLSDFVSIYSMNNDPDLGENETHVVDLAGTVNGTVYGGASHSDTGGKFRGSVLFGGAGSDDGILLGDNVTFNEQFTNGNSWSVDAWIRRDTSAVSMRVMSKGGDSIGCWSMRVGAGDDFYVQIQGNCSFATKCTVIDTSTTLTTGQWQHVGFTYNTTNNIITSYVDGFTSGTADCSGIFDVVNKTHWDNSNKLTVIGGATNTDMNGLTSEFDGRIDHVRIWNKDLTSDEWADLFELEKGMYYWNLTAVEVYKPELNFTNYTSEFQIGCDINCSLNKTYSSPSIFDCNGENVTFTQSGKTIIDGIDIIDWQNALASTQCKFENKNGGKFF